MKIGSHFKENIMLKEERARQELEAQRNCLYAELYQRAASMGVRSLEALCRRIHSIEIKIHSFKGGLYDKK